MTTADPIASLPAPIRERLERFSLNVERIDIDQLPMYAARPLGSDHRRTIDDADLVAIESGREDAVGAVRSTALDYVNRKFVQAQFRPTWAGLAWVSAGTVDDRMRIANSLGEAMIAVALWDVLDEADRDEMLGPWASLVA
jgi:hypothetical protein